MTLEDPWLDFVRDETFVPDFPSDVGRFNPGGKLHGVPFRRGFQGIDDHVSQDPGNQEGVRFQRDVFFRPFLF
jgi:hypothetical protein